MKAKHKKRINIFEACERAGQMLIESGFEFRYQSKITETKYYGLPGRQHNIRVSAHKSKRGPIGVPETVAKITFHAGGCETPQHIAISDEAFEHMVAVAIGFYMMKSTRPMVSSWRGKKGTWGTVSAASHGAATIMA